MGDKFSYHQMHPVYVIVLIEDSSAEMRAVAPHYIHNRIVSYDSGAKISELANICYVSLDTFRNTRQNKIEKPLDAWLTLLSERDVSAVINLINQWPEFLEIYQEIAAYRKHPKELINMYSEALAIMDHNMEVMMLDEERQRNAQLQADIDAMQIRLDESLHETAVSREEIAMSRQENINLKAKIAELESQLSQK